MSDEWKPIPEFDGYQISKLGVVRSTKRKHLFIMKGTLSRRGYLKCCLYSKDGAHMKFIHRLVLETFVGKCPPGMQTAHLNGNRTDNRISNLAWTTVKENHEHKKLHGTYLFGSRAVNSKLKDKKIKKIRNLIRRGLTQKFIAKQMGVSQSNISLIKNGLMWRHVK